MSVGRRRARRALGGKLFARKEEDDVWMRMMMRASAAI